MLNEKLDQNNINVIYLFNFIKTQNYVLQDDFAYAKKIHHYVKSKSIFFC